jgi:lipopolysaccharide transport system ATP-binding protein
MEPSISVEHLTKIFQWNATELTWPRSLHEVLRMGSTSNVAHHSKTAVSDLSFRVEAGERIGIVGRNGAGKSTLLSMLAGLSQPTSGSINIVGKVTSVMSLGLGLREDLTGRENIYIDGELKGQSREDVDMAVDEVIKFADLGEFIDLPLRTYSTGMKARLAFSTLVNLQPEILIIDETLSVGDAQFAEKAFKRIQQLCNIGKIVIVVSHNLSSIVQMCNRCIWMDGGRIVMDGAPEAVTDAYSTAVRREDEAMLCKRFGNHNRAISYALGYEVRGCITRQRNSNEPCSLFESESKDDLEIEICCRIPSQASDVEIRVSVIRLDGLLISKAKCSHREVVSRHPSDRDFQYVLSMRPLVLGEGVYTLVVELVRIGEVQASNATVIEVKTRTPPSGGRPVLLYPYDIQIKEVAY